MDHDKENIDQLLKEQFEHFAPDAPDVWSGVSQGIGSELSAGTTSTGIKSASIMIKTVAAVAVVSTITVITIYIIKENSNRVAKVVEQSIPSQVVESPKQLDVANKTKTEVPAKSVDYDTAKQEKKNKPAAPNGKVELVPTPITPIVEKEVAPVKSTEFADKTAPQKITALPKPTLETSPKESANHKHDIEQQKREDKKPDEPTKNIRVVVPNVFTPNYDGLNDEFVVEIDDCMEYAIKIINYRGMVVYESTNLQEHWNGKIKNIGEECQSGEYVFTIKFSTYYADSQTKIGKINLIR